MPVFDKVSQNFANFSNNQNLKKSLEEKNREKSRIYGYVGMEAYDLYKEQKLSAPELEIHFEKLGALEKEILEIEEKLTQLVSSDKIVCSCGYALNGQMKFCPKCGRPVESDMITCTCGKKIKGDMSFCPYCGNKLKGNSGKPAAKEPEAVQKEETFRECICGAKIPEGQFMCMECGRKIED